MSTTTLTFQFPTNPPSTTTTSSTQGQINVTSAAIQATGSTRSSGSLYTVAIYALNYQGRVYIEATLANNPTEEDWFPVVLPGLSTPYVEFPYADATNSGGVSVAGFSFKGSFAWLRARQDRDYLGLTQPVSPSYGYIDKIELNLGTWILNPNLSTTNVQTLTSVDTVKGNNLGDGTKIYANSIGVSNVLLNFKTIKAGNSVTFDVDDTSITINSIAGGGGSGATAFTGLNDVADHEIISNAVVFGNGGLLHFSNTANVAGTVLTYTANGIDWALPPVTDWGVNLKQNGTSIVSSAKQMNFTGNGVTIANVSGVPTITIPGGNATGAGTTEHVTLLYTAGSSGNLSGTDAIFETTSGVTAIVRDQAQCIVEFTFPAQSAPPISIAIMGQVYATNEFIYSNINPSSSPSRRIQSGGTADAPTLMTNFGSTTVRLQLRMQDTSASAGAGQRTRTIVVFRF